MPQTLTYESTEEMLSIYFRAPAVDLRDLGIVANALHRSISEAIVAGFAPSISRVVALGSRRRFDDPLFISLGIEGLDRGSFRAKCRLALSPEVQKQLAGNVAGSLIASAIWAISAAAINNSNKPPPPPPPAIEHAQPTPDVAKNVRLMVRRLSETGKPWELTLRDGKTGYEVTIRSAEAER